MSSVLLEAALEPDELAELDEELEEELEELGELEKDMIWVLAQVRGKSKPRRTTWTNVKVEGGGEMPCSQANVHRVLKKREAGSNFSKRWKCPKPCTTTFSAQHVRMSK